MYIVYTFVFMSNKIASYLILLSSGWEKVNVQISLQQSLQKSIANIFIFKQLREQYLKAYYYTQPSYLKFEQLFRSSNNTVLLKLDTFSTLISK